MASDGADAQAQLVAKLEEISEVVDEASLGTEDQQRDAKSTALKYYSELEGILRAAAAEVNGFFEQQDLRHEIQRLQHDLQERDQQLQAAQADCSASHAAASAQATALTEKLARVREQYAQELALLNQTVAAAKQAGAESAEQATSLDLHLQQCRSQLDQTQQKARHCETELTTALDAARQKAALAAAAAQSGMDALLTQHAEAQEHATAIEADLTAVQQQHADSQAQLDAQRHGQAAFTLLVASVLSRSHDDLSDMAAAYPAVVPQPVNAQLADDCRAALGVMQSGAVDLGGTSTDASLRAAVGTISAALASQSGGLREGLAGALQGQLEAAAAARAAADQLQQLTQANQELRRQCEELQAEHAQQHATWETRIADTSVSGAAALQLAQADSAAAAARCIALLEELAALQWRCDILESSCEQQAAELAAASEMAGMTELQVQELQQRAAAQQRSLDDSMQSAAAAARRLHAEVAQAQQCVSELEATNDSLRSEAQRDAAEHAAAMLRLAVDWDSRLAAEQSSYRAQLQQQADDLAEQRGEWKAKLAEHERSAAQQRSDAEAAAARASALTIQHEQQAAASEQLISRLSAEVLAAQAQAKRELQVMSSRCKSLQQQLAAQVTALGDLRTTSAQQAADVAAAAAARLDNGLAEQRSQLQAEFYDQSLQAQAAADDALQQALDSAADHRQVLLAQADSERQRAEETHAAVDELRAAHGEELQRQSAAHARLCDELQAQAEADAVAAARLAAEAASSQQAAAQAATDAAAAREVQLQGALKQVTADFREEIAALEAAGSRERRSHQHQLASAADAVARQAAALAAAAQAHDEDVKLSTASHERQAAAQAAQHAADRQRMEQRLTEQAAAEAAARAAWTDSQERLEQRCEEAAAQLEHVKQEAQELLAQLQAEHADALDAAYSELAVQQGARQRLDAALAAASVELAALQHEAAATEAALACRVAALEQEQRDRPPRLEDAEEMAELRALARGQEARAQAAEVSLHSLRKEVMLRGDSARSGIKSGLSEVRSKLALGQTMAAQSGVMAWMKDGGMQRAGGPRGQPRPPKLS